MRSLPRFNRIKLKEFGEYFVLSKWCENLEGDIASELGHRFSNRVMDRLQSFYRFDYGTRTRHINDFTVSELEERGMSYRELSDDCMHEGYFTDRFLLVPRFYGTNAVPVGSEILVDYDRFCNLRYNFQSVEDNHRKRIQRYLEDIEEEEAGSNRPIPLNYLAEIQSKFEVPEPGQKHRYCAVCRIEFTEGNYIEHINGETHAECVSSPHESLLYAEIDSIIGSLDVKFQDSLKTQKQI